MSAASSPTKTSIGFSAGEIRSVRLLRGVVNAGVTQSADLAVSKFSPTTGLGSPGQAVTMPILATDSSAMRALGVKFSLGRGFDLSVDRFHATVAVVGNIAAQELDLPQLSTEPYIWIDGVPFLVIGIANQDGVEPGNLNGVYIPFATASSLFKMNLDQNGPQEAVIETKPGSAQIVALQAQYLLDPRDPTTVESLAPPDPKSFRQSIEHQVAQIFYLLSAMTVAIGTISIATVSNATMSNRSSEIGLRRAMGAERSDILLQITFESGYIGFFSGLVSTAFAILTISLTSSFERWQPTVDPRILFLAPIVGGMLGIIGGFMPAIKASSIEPSRALRL